MMILYHAPRSRSSTIVALIHELGATDRVEIRPVTIPRQDGSGGRDPLNPHPEGKVPYLVTPTGPVRERGAIVLSLCEAFPEAGLAPGPGEEGRGEFLSWLFYYQGVIEPVLVGQVMGVDHPVFRATFRGPAEMAETLQAALEKGPYLMGERFTAADLLVFSPFGWFPQIMPDVPVIRDWVARVMARPSLQKVAEWDEQLIAG
ncbi:glutathione S-transferase family protein [Sinirhodobacter sp. WL0062]|uniref:Glutathione S-transferase family protein n=2 Tax=Rhodobacter flavimaris TaxID=2907145 RepID=A0ABS8YXG9_9RHOB|nr:glutathione S-transferase family protein [Sinirhodobacter sp. WL0062]